jgi:hypothetical protein
MPVFSLKGHTEPKSLPARAIFNFFGGYEFPKAVLERLAALIRAKAAGGFNKTLALLLSSLFRLRLYGLWRFCHRDAQLLVVR